LEIFPGPSFPKRGKAFGKGKMGGIFSGKVYFILEQLISTMKRTDK
jgi:hypothetical protein